MSMTDPIADFLTRIRNGQQAKKKIVTAPASKQKLAIANVLKSEGYIAEVKESGEGAKKEIAVTLKYYDGKPVIESLRRASKPSLRRYENQNSIPEVMGGLGVAIVSTSKGLLTDKQAKAQGIGGEVLCFVA